MTHTDAGTPEVGERRLLDPRRLAKLVRALIGVALVVAVGYAIVRQWSEVRDTILAIPWPNLLLAFVAALGGMACNVMAWRQVLRTLGHQLTPTVAGRCYLVGGLGKYLPGSVWAFVLQVELAKRAGVPRAHGFAATLIALGLATATALVIGIPALPDLLSLGGALPWLVLVIIPIAVVCALPPVLTRLVNLVLRVLRRSPLPHGLSWADTGRAVAWCALAWVLFGTHLWLLATAESAAGLEGLLRCIGAFALAMTAGLLAALAPSGIGVREAVIVAALLPYVPVGVALGIALASRLVFTVADLTAAGVAALSGVWTRRHAAVEVIG